MPEVRAALEATLGPIFRIEREVEPVSPCRVFVVDELPESRQFVVTVLPSEFSLALNSTTFEREILLLADRLAHPRLIQPRLAGLAGRFIYHMRRYVPGTTVRSRLVRLGPLPLHQVVHILHDVLAGLAYAHAQGVVHGDLRPDHVMLNDTGAALADAGVLDAVSAALDGEAPGAATEALCAADYVAPERRADGAPAEPASDVFGVGALAYAMLTGEPPGRRHPGRLDDRRAIPQGLREFVTRCLADDPAERWRDAAEALPVLAGVEKGEERSKGWRVEESRVEESKSRRSKS